MSVDINNKTIKSEIFITKEDAGKAFDILKQKVLSQGELSGWITIGEVEQSNTLLELMTAMRWIPELNNNGNVISLTHDGFGVAEEDLLFKTIAPYVQANSFVEFEREGYSSDLKVRYDFINSLVTKTVWNKVYNENIMQDEFLLNNEYTELL